MSDSGSTPIFGIRRFPFDGEDGVWMPADVADALFSAYLDTLSISDESWRKAFCEEISNQRSRGTRVVARLTARYQKATAPPPPKWETALRELYQACDEESDTWVNRLILTVRAALVEEQGE